MAKKNLEVIEYIFPDGEGVLGFTHSGGRFKLPNGGEIVAVEPKGKTAIALLQWGGFRDIIHQLMPAWVEWEKPYSLKEDDLCWWDESSETHVFRDCARQHRSSAISEKDFSPSNHTGKN